MKHLFFIVLIVIIAIGTSCQKQSPLTATPQIQPTLEEWLVGEWVTLREYQAGVTDTNWYEVVGAPGTPLFITDSTFHGVSYYVSNDSIYVEMFPGEYWPRHIQSYSFSTNRMTIYVDDWMGSGWKKLWIYEKVN